MASSISYKLFKKYILIKKNNPVINVNGKAFIINFFNPFLKDLSISFMRLNECLTEWRKQKYIVKAKIGVKKRFNIIIEKKSNNIIFFNSMDLPMDK